MVSVVIAVKDGEAYLAEAIESVLAQSYDRCEVIVIDGGSADRSAEIASSFEGVRCLSQRSEGLAAAWNEGIEAGAGELVAFLDSDDRWLPGKIEAQVRLLDADPDLAGAIGRVRFFLEPGKEPPPMFRRELLGSDQVAPMPGALLVRRSAFETVGLFSPEHAIATDIDWFARLKDAGLKLGVVDEVVIEKRAHDSNLSHSDGALYAQGLLRSLRESVRRQGSE